MKVFSIDFFPKSSVHFLLAFVKAFFLLLYLTNSKQWCWACSNVFFFFFFMKQNKKEQNLFSERRFIFPRYDYQISFQSTPEGWPFRMAHITHKYSLLKIGELWFFFSLIILFISFKKKIQRNCFLSFFFNSQKESSSCKYQHREFRQQTNLWNHHLKKNTKTISSSFLGFKLSIKKKVWLEILPVLIETTTALFR